MSTAFATDAALLTQYAFEDCSLSEIAEREGVSRQAVRDAIARGEAELMQMEARLRVIERTERTLRLLDEAEQLDASKELREKLSAIRRVWEDNDGV